MVTNNKVRKNKDWQKMKGRAVIKLYNMSYLFTSESVSEGHPDKLADQISDAIIDNYLHLIKNQKLLVKL